MFALIKLLCYYINMKKLKEIRISKNFTCAQMAEKLGITKSYYWKIENARSLLSYKMAWNIAKILDLKPDDLFYEEFEEKSKN